MLPFGSHIIPFVTPKLFVVFERLLALPRQWTLPRIKSIWTSSVHRPTSLHFTPRLYVSEARALLCEKQTVEISALGDGLFRKVASWASRDGLRTSTKDSGTLVRYETLIR